MHSAAHSSESATLTIGGATLCFLILLLSTCFGFVLPTTLRKWSQFVAQEEFARSGAAGTVLTLDVVVETVVLLTVIDVVVLVSVAVEVVVDTVDVEQSM